MVSDNMHQQSEATIEFWQEWQAEYLNDSQANDQLLARTSQVLEYSDYFKTEVGRHPELLLQLFTTGVLNKVFKPELSPPDMMPDVSADEATFMRQLRRFRKQHMLWLYWRDLADEASLEETFAHISWLADTCVQLALVWAHNFSCQRFGVATEDLQPLLIMAMGKYGAEELNVSSDIDLIFCYNDEQELSGRLRALEPFYTQVGRKLIQLLDQRTADGFVFRIDMRLRPYGDSGPLVMSQSAMESYYLEQGRDWERFAMIKARFITGTETQRSELYDILKPFVFRRYVDFSVLEAPRKMKRLIESEIRRRNLGANIKLGAGGIREIEFFAQALQLIHGGRDPRLQQRELLPMLGMLAEVGLVDEIIANKLEVAYRFLRKLEHRLQAYKDEQTQTLPATESDCQRLARSMGFPDWSACQTEIESQRAQVNQIFSELFATGEVEQATTEVEFEDLWINEDNTASFAVLAPLGAEQASAVVSHIAQFRQESSIRNMGPRGTKVLDELMPKVLQRFIERGYELTTLQRLTSLLRAIARRTAYLDLLNENNGALKHLLSLCSRSALIADQLAEFPYVLDELLDPKLFLVPPAPDGFQTSLRQQLSRIPEEDIETRMDVLREFKQTYLLRLSAALCADVIDVVHLGKSLSNLAETIINEACAIAWFELVHKYGAPLIADDENSVTPGFGVVAYGKLGGQEMGFNSDLDLVFIYSVEDGQTQGEKPVDNRSFYMRLAQKIIHILSVRTRTGVLYEVDMRLRPSGNSGMLVSDISAFETYQKNEAWTWEHQALIRSRCILASPVLTERFNSIRKAVLCRKRDATELLADVKKMRKRMRDHLLKPLKDKQMVDIKQSPGGVADVEFLVQFWVLNNANTHPELTRHTRCQALLDDLQNVPELSALPLADLSAVYADLQAKTNELALQKQPALIAEDLLPEGNASLVRQLWLDVFGLENGSG